MPNNRDELESNLEQVKEKSDEDECRINPNNGELIDNDQKYMQMCKTFSNEIKSIVNIYGNFDEYDQI
jgi:hypothetical protein